MAADYDEVYVYRKALMAISYGAWVEDGGCRHCGSRDWERFGRWLHHAADCPIGVAEVALTLPRPPERLLRKVFTPEGP